MIKMNIRSKIFVVVLSIGVSASSINAQAVGGICSGSACGALATKGSDSAREYSLQKYQSTLAKLKKTSPSNHAELAAKAEREHLQVVTEWVAKKHPQMTPGSFQHDITIEREMERDMQEEAPEVYTRISHEL